MAAVDNTVYVHLSGHDLQRPLPGAGYESLHHSSGLEGEQYSGLYYCASEPGELRGLPSDDGSASADFGSQWSRSAARSGDAPDRPIMPSYLEIQRPPNYDYPLDNEAQQSNLLCNFRGPSQPYAVAASGRPPQPIPNTAPGTIVHQPLPQLQMVAPGRMVQLQSVFQPVVFLSASAKRDWSTPLCGCFMDAGTCCAGFFCPCFYTCHLAQQMNEDCCVGCCTPCALVSMRAKVRTQEKIKGGICYDTALHICCYPCELTQLGREVKNVKMKAVQSQTTQNQLTMVHHSTQRQNAVIATQPAVIFVRTADRLEREWSTELCDCCSDCSTCCASFYCPLCYTCYLAVEMNEHCCVGVFTPGALIAMRTKIRASENIRGGICLDTAKYIFCHTCALSQLGIEVKRVKHRGGSL